VPEISEIAIRLLGPAQQACSDVGIAGQRAFETSWLVDLHYFVWTQEYETER